MSELVKLEDIIPAQASFRLKKKENKEYFLKPVDMSDQVWVRENLGDEDAVKKIFDLKNLNATKVSMLIYRLLNQQDRADFLAYEKTDINDDGVKKKVLVTGPEVLLKHISQNEFLPIIGALNRTFIDSSPMKDTMIEMAKKKVMEINKQSRTTEKSSKS